MTVLHVLKSNIYSGAENVATNIIKSMRPEYDAVYLTAEGPIETKLLELDIKYIAVEKVNEDELKKAIEQVKPDIIHAHDFGCSLMAAKVARDIPVISHLHSNPAWIGKIHPKAIAYGSVCKSFAKILTVSESVEQEAWFRDKMKGRTLCVGNPFDARAVFERGYLAATEQTEEKKAKYVSDILYVGRLTTEKNPTEFINIIAEIKKTFPHIRAIMVGNGDLGSSCLKQIEKLGLEENIKMVGFQSNPYNYMNMTKLLIMPSLYEGFGLVALEAMCFGKPVLGSQVGGLQHIINDKCGAICGNAKKPVDREAFAAAAVELLGNEELYRAKADGARRRAREYDNYDSYMDTIRGIYQEILSKEGK